MRGLFPYRYHVISLPKPPFILSGFTCHCSPGTLTSLRHPAPWGAPDRLLPLHYVCLLASTPVSGVFLLPGLPSFKLLADWFLNMTFSKNSYFIQEALLLLTQDFFFLKWLRFYRTKDQLICWALVFSKALCWALSCFFYTSQQPVKVYLITFPLWVRKQRHRQLN